MWQSLFRDLFEGLVQQAESPTERLVLGLHIYTVARELQCSGLREEDEETEEMVPAGWNRNKQVFSFRYKHASGCSLYVKVVKVGERAITVHSLRSDAQGKIWTWKIPAEVISEVESNGATTDYLLSTVLSMYQQEILDKTFPAPKPVPSNPLLIEHHPAQSPVWAQPSMPYGSQFYPPVGASDLYPGMPSLGGGLVGPQHPLFQGAQGRRQPGRLDPLGPFEQVPGQRNPDHFPPPGGFGGGFGSGFGGGFI